ncbi:beta-N-acetylhexosaminidase [Glutamicibacter uratoxydans]|uniref:beta-N-acetylhexosaminidase n=1 Tax=Glutamicibacter uratoxydans TaxID=43667 RepID=A0A4Y4DLU4_GLUUR|nr:glycoside hydrolase family 3 N-terminal domain-containing protein [Glutamicibacter uratoxydans]GED06309.1 beta-N-acetylhexosaminidase [Glutamicibacter uratoxydans]
MTTRIRQVACLGILSGLLLAGCSAAQPQTENTLASSSLGTSTSTAEGSTPEPTSEPSSGPSSSSEASTSPAVPSSTHGTEAPKTIAEQAQALARKMSPSQQAASLVMAGIPAAGATDGEISQLQKQGISNIFLRGRSQLSVSQTAEQVKKAAGALEQNLPQDLPVWVATDQEGGFVRVLQGPGFSELPTAQKQGQWSQATLKSRLAGVGAELVKAGINVNLAPVADVVPKSIGTANAPIGYFGRQYGDNAQDVASSVLTANQSFAEAGVQPVVKHFPGLGKVTANTDVSSSVTDSTTGADSPDLAPFKKSIAQDLSWVMISNARYTKIDAKNDAPFSSKVITGLLREKLGYERLVISDDLCEAQQVESVPVGQRAVKFVAAGGTMPLCVNTENSLVMAKALADKAEGDAAFAGKVQDAAALVLQEKLRQQK